MKVSRINHWLLFFIFICFVQSCDKNESLTGVADLSENDIIDLIKLNFLEQYGGIEAERMAVFQLTKDYLNSCGLDTLVVLKLGQSGDKFKLTLTGDYNINCFNETSAYYDKHFNYFDAGSVGNSTINTKSQQYDAQSHITIANNTAENVFVTSVNTIRNLSFNSKLLGNFNGNITFVTNLIEFDFPTCNVTDQLIYTLHLEIFEKDFNGDQRDVKGTIQKIGGRWVFTDEEGNQTILD